MSEKIEEKKKNNGLLIGIICVLFIVIFCLIGYILFDKKDNTKDINKNDEVVLDTEKLEVDNNDKVQIRKNFNVIMKKISIFNYSKVDAKSDLISTQTYGINSELFTNLTISNELKKYIAIDASDSHPYQEYENSIKETMGPNFVGVDDAIVVKQDEAEKLYYDLFGEKTEISSKPEVVQCPGYEYDSVNKTFYGFARCGGASAGSIQFLLTDYQKIDKDTITVKVYFAKIDPVNVGQYEFVDFDNNIIDNGITANDSFKLSNDNKDKFNSYTLTYKLNDNKVYTFNSISKN